jgi:transmembrane sensor
MHSKDIQSMIKDESFLNYCFCTNKDDVAYWENWLNENPDFKDKVAGLKSMVIQMAWYSQDHIVQDQVLKMKQLIKEVPSIQRQLTIRKLVIRLSVAAVLLCAISFSLNYWVNNKNQQNIIAKTKNASANKAVLTLANGKQIVLDDIKNGESLDQNGIIISKAANEQIVYHGSSATNAANIPYNTIATPIGGQYQVVLPDGTKVVLNAASSLQYPIAFSGKQRKVVLNGEGYFEVAKNKEMPFTVNANGVDVQVLGTHFNITAYHNDIEVITTLLEGSVRMVKGNNFVLLSIGQQGIATQNKPGIDVLPADLAEAVAWRKGVIVFNNESLQDVMKKAARWYDIEVDYQGDIIDKKFGGKIYRYNSIKELLDNMAITGGINYKIEGRRILITN